MKNGPEFLKHYLAGKFNSYDGLNEHMKMLMSQRGWRKTKGSGRMKSIRQDKYTVNQHMENSELWHADIQLVWHDINDRDIYTGL